MTVSYTCDLHSVSLCLRGWNNVQTGHDPSEYECPSRPASLFAPCSADRARIKTAMPLNTAYLCMACSCLRPKLP
eukprot:1193746-Prorocentrum_minimum.AAC.1